MSQYNEQSSSKLVIKAHLRINFTIRLVEYFQIFAKFAVKCAPYTLTFKWIANENVFC
jgi:hypothetical protein